MMHYVMTILFFVIIFGLVVFSHEFGHFLIAKVNGIRVVEFMMGMGPKLISWKVKDTVYSIRLFPIGGACMFEGEDGLNTNEDEPLSQGAFPNANVWSRIATVFAGPFFNFILAILVAFIMVQLIFVRDPYVEIVSDGGAALEAGILSGDIIYSMNGERLHIFDEMFDYAQMSMGQPVKVVVIRNGEKKEFSITPKLENDGRYYFGIANKTPVKVKGLKCFQYAWYEVRAGVKKTYKSLFMLVTGKVGRKDVAGPLGVANIVGDIYEETKESWLDVLVNMMNITMLLSVNLGIMNILPLPALDGGRLVFLLLEVVRGKPIPPEKEGMVHFIGLIFFMILMVLVFFNDIVNIIG